MGRKRIIRRAKVTVLLVGEGDSDVAFLKYLASLYNHRCCGVACTIRNAHGKGPEHVVDYAIGQLRDRAFDTAAALIDTDLPWPPSMQKKAKAKHIELVPSKPCLEGLLLRVLGLSVPARSAECKRCLKHMDLLRADGYGPHFPQDLLDRRKDEITTLGWLIDAMAGQR